VPVRPIMPAPFRSGGLSPGSVLSWPHDVYSVLYLSNIALLNYRDTTRPRSWIWRFGIHIEWRHMSWPRFLWRTRGLKQWSLSLKIRSRARLLLPIICMILRGESTVSVPIVTKKDLISTPRPHGRFCDAASILPDSNGEIIREIARTILHIVSGSNGANLAQKAVMTCSILMQDVWGRSWTDRRVLASPGVDLRPVDDSSVRHPRTSFVFTFI
jgi:hypothetical protein